MASSTIGQASPFLGTPTQMACKTTGAEREGGGCRYAGNLAGPVFAGVKKLRGIVSIGGLPTTRLMLLIPENDPRMIIGYTWTNPATGAYEFTNLPSAPHLVLKVAANNFERAQVYDWEVPSLP